MNDSKIVKAILKKFYDIDRNPTYLFGSRVRGDFRPNSDLDLLIDDQNLASHLVTQLEEAFEESELLYKVDIVLKSRITQDFYLNIQNQLQKIDQ